MTTVRKEIITWLHTQTYWVQKAAELLLKEQVVDAVQLDILKELLKTPLGQVKSKKVDFSFFDDYVAPDVKLKLKSIGNIIGIDNLNPKIPLPFHDDFTVVYGFNGSGKSGYTRIIKKACGKANAIALKANVYQPLPIEQKCTIGLDDGNGAVDIEWVSNSAAIEKLRPVDVFDATTGRFYLEKENEVSYVPLELSLFEELVIICDKVKGLLTQEQNLLISNLPAYPQEFKNTKYITAIYTRLKKDVDEQVIIDFFTFIDEDKQEVEALKERLKGDPQNLIDAKASEKNQLEAIVSGISDAVNLVSKASCEQLSVKYQKSLEARVIAQEGAKVIANNTILDGLGSTTWKALWMAAKTFSNTEAYPEQLAPYTDDEAHCVLCHQTLDDSAKQRLISFEIYVGGELESAAIKAEKDYQTQLQQLPIRLKKDQIVTQLNAARLDEEQWLPIIESIWQAIDDSTTKIKNKPNEVNIYYQLPENILLPLTNKTNNLTKEIEQHNIDVQSFNKVKINSDLLDLLAKQWAFGYLTQITDEVSRLQKNDQFEAWKKFTTSAVITKKGGEVTKILITEAYVDRFNNELVLLGAGNISVELVKGRASKGKVMHKLQLKGVNLQFSKSKSVDVLSEGEQRIVSLAAFLADVTGKPYSAPFIFDDPISSLDQKYEETTAKRLLDLAKERQVIVFTHRISFLSALTTYGDPECIHIKRESWGCGEHGQIPLFAKKPINALKDLRNGRLTQAKKIFETVGSDFYDPLAKAICSDIRILIERIVEVEFLADVIQRHRREVHTKGKINNLAKITIDDCLLIEKFMTDFSSHEHSQSNEAPVAVPTPEYLDSALRELLDWHNEFKSRKIFEVV
jgi:hypothetical protein